MRQFIYSLTKFCLPLIIIIIGFFSYAEYTLYFYPSTFQLKALHFKKNKNKIDVLTLGSSHNQTAINPEFLRDHKLSNLAFGGQDIRIDSALFSNVTRQLPNLRLVVFELSYHTLEHRNSVDYHRNSLYLRFYDLNLFGRNTKITDYSIYLSRPKLYNRFLNPLEEKTPVNEYGFATELSANDSELHRFKNLNYNENIILSDTSNMFIKRHKYEDIEAYNINTASLSYMIKMCIQDGIIPVIISPPVFKNYYNSYIDSKEMRRKNYINLITNKYPLVINLDYEKDSRFVVKDFKNEDHLNPIGAEKFSRILNDTLTEIKARTHNIGYK